MEENPKIFFERLSLSILLILSFIISAAAIMSLGAQADVTGDLFGTANVLLILSGLLQIEVSGFLTRILEHYSDSEFGPPSHETRRIFILYSPDRWWSVMWGDLFFFQPRTGFWLVFIGTALGIPAVWL